MGTKANPGKYDCYAKAGDHEPIFTFKASDVDAPLAIMYWLDLKRRRGTEKEEKLIEASDCAQAMSAWYMEHVWNPLFNKD